MYSINNEKEPILEVQRALFVLGYGESHLVPIDGVYGENTRLAVMNFQHRNGLGITGSVNYETHQLLFEEYERVQRERNDTTFPLKKGARSETIRTLNFYLRALFPQSNEIKASSISDSFDEETIANLKKFYLRIGRPISEEISKNLFHRLIAEVEMLNEIQAQL